VRDGVSGALVAGHDVGEWADAVGGLLHRRSDAMSRAAVSHAANFSWSRTVDGLLGAYGRAIGEYGVMHRRGVARALVSRRNGRRWTMRRGVRA